MRTNTTTKGTDAQKAKEATETEKCDDDKEEELSQQQTEEDGTIRRAAVGRVTAAATAATAATTATVARYFYGDIIPSNLHAGGMSNLYADRPILSTMVNGPANWGPYLGEIVDGIS
jgi:hypothetical protein